MTTVKIVLQKSILKRKTWLPDSVYNFCNTNISHYLKLTASLVLLKVYFSERNIPSSKQIVNFYIHITKVIIRK